MKKQDYVSFSQINKFMLCPIAFKYHYEDGIKQDSNIYMEYGSAIHHALAYNNMQKVKTKKDESIEILYKKFYEYLNIECKKRRGWFKSDIYNDMLIMGEIILGKYLKEIAPNYQPLYVEQTYKIKLKHFPITILAIIDVIMDNGEVWDYKTVGKTTKKNWVQKEVDKSFQLTLYSGAYRKEHQKIEKGLSIITLPREAKPVITKVDTTRTQDDILYLLEYASLMDEVCKKGVYVPNLKNCSQCPYNKTCKKQIIIK